MNSMTTSHSPILDRPALVRVFGGAALFGLLIWLLLPSMVVVIDDDFWYLKSVVETFQRGRPWTSEYLAPWAASTSSLAALVFALTDRMSLAVHGQLAIAGFLSCLGLTLWLRDLGVSTSRRWMAALVLLASPTVLFMHLLFTGVALYWGCLWMSVWAYGRRRWWVFLMFWAVALANRQSAITWLALPGWYFLTEGWQRKDWRPVQMMVAAGVWFLLVKKGMNPNIGQQWVNHEAFDLSRLGTRPVTLALCLAALTTGFGLSGFARPDAWKVRLWAALPAMALGALAGIKCLTFIVWTHNGYNDPYVEFYFGVLGAFAGLGLVVGGVRRPAVGALIAALGGMVLLTLYSGKFDYYFVEILWWGVVAGAAGASSSATSSATGRVWQWIALILALVVIVLNARFMARLKLEQHRFAAFNTLYEKAYRDGSLKLHETGLTTMGHMGWWLEDYYREKTGPRSFGDLAGFIRLCDNWDSTDGGVSLVTELPKSFRKVNAWLPSRTSKILNRPEAREIGSLKQRVLFFWDATYRLKQLKRQHPAAHEVEIDYATFKARPFPLDDEEWSRLLRGR